MRDRRTGVQPWLLRKSLMLLRATCSAINGFREQTLCEFGEATPGKEPQELADSSAANKACSSGDEATTTRLAPASRRTAAIRGERQYCGRESADISTPAARIASIKACALRPE